MSHLGYCISSQNVTIPLISEIYQSESVSQIINPGLCSSEFLAGEFKKIFFFDPAIFFFIPEMTTCCEANYRQLNRPKSQPSPLFF
jgi:hypothetical protein